MTESTPKPAIEFPDGNTAMAVRVSGRDELPGALTELGLVPPRPVVVVIGGAGGFEESDIERLRSLFAQAIVPVLGEHHAVGVDGGTSAGVMSLFGETRAAAGADFPLLGVVAEGTVALPGDPTSAERAELEPNHSHFILVPGDQWGDESPWIADAATTLAAHVPSVTVLINGGQIALRDVEASVDVGREVIVIEGSGRTADALAAALAGTPTDPRAAAVAARGAMRSLPADDPARLAATLADVLATSRG
jgi:hypothetical protein